MKFDQTVRKRTVEDAGPYSMFSVYVNFAAVGIAKQFVFGRSKPLPYGLWWVCFMPWVLNPKTKAPPFQSGA